MSTTCDMSLEKRQERKSREKETRKKEILDSSITVFSKYGFVKTSMELVANEAALAVGTLYRYYKSKEELFVSIVFEAISTMHIGLERITEKDISSEKKLKHIWDYYYQFHQDNPMYYQAMLFLHDPSFAKAFSEPAHKSVVEFMAKNFKLSARIIQDGIDDNSFERNNPYEVSDFIWSTFVGLVNLIETRKQFGTGKHDMGKVHKAMWPKVKRAIIKVS